MVTICDGSVCSTWPSAPGRRAWRDHLRRVGGGVGEGGRI